MAQQPGLKEALATFLAKAAQFEALIADPQGSELQQLTSSFLAGHSLSALFEALVAATKEGDDSLVQLGSKVLEKLLGSMNLVEAAGGVPALLPFFRAALASGNPHVCEAASTVLLAMAKGRHAGMVLADGATLGALCERLTDEGTSLGDRTISTLVALGSGGDAPAASAVFSALVAFRSAWDGGRHSAAEAEEEGTAAPSIVHMRVLTVVSRLVGTGEAAASAASEAGLLGALLDAMASDDLLLQMNVMELLPALAQSATGFGALAGRRGGGATGGDTSSSSSGSGSGSVWGSLLRWSGAEGPEWDGLLGPASLAAVAEVFAAVVQRDPTGAAALVAGVIPGLLRAASRACAAAGTGGSSEDTMIAMGAVSTAAAADVSVVEGLLADQEGTREWLELGVSSSPELRAATFSCLARIFHGARQAIARRAGGGGAPPQPAEELQWAERYVALSDALGRSCLPRDTLGGGVEVALQALRRPIPEPRHAAYDFLAALASLPHPGGVRRICACPGAVTYLLDRGTETSKEGKEWKFGVVDSVVHNGALQPSLRAVVGEGVAEQFTKFHSLGAYAASGRGPAGVAVMQL